MKTTALETPGNVITLTVEQKPQPKPQAAPAPFRQRFKVLEFTNRGGSQCWRVSGIKRDGTRVRENHADAEFARKRQAQLEVEYLARPGNPDAALPEIRTTRLTDVQLRICEAALSKLDSDDDLLPAVSYWLRHGKAATVKESPRVDEAVDAFLLWLETTESLRHESKGNLRRRVDLFRNSISNLRVADITPETIDEFLDKRGVTATTKDNDRRAISRFFSWTMDRKRRWTAINPCHAVKVERSERRGPAVLTVEECQKLLRRAETYERGILAPYFAVCLFGGLRPWEAQRLTWAQVNLADREIRLEAEQTKTNTPRVVKICDTLLAWLEVYKNRKFYPSAWRKHFIAVEKAAGYGPGLKSLPPDVMRHTAISHYFRKTGSYGQTAEQFGNSEAVIKKHYQGRVSTEDTKAFYALLPKKGGCK